VLAQALLVHETTAAFEFVGKCFLEYCCPGGVEPLTIITDADLAEANAIRTVFPNARHLRCSWHLMNNVVAHSTSWCKNIAGSVQASFKRAMYARTAAHFNAAWAQLLQVRLFWPPLMELSFGDVSFLKHF
jgi:hypothetical protein